MTIEKKLDKIELELFKTEMKLDIAINALKWIKSTSENYEEDDVYYSTAKKALGDIDNV
jgi:hypothetical protein